MEAQYYTPTIDEFHSGFEYEFMPLETSEDYKTYAFPKYPSNATYIKYDTKNALEVVENYLDNGQIRVKHLDRQDIEECRWSFIKKDEFGRDSYRLIDSAGLGGINDTVYEMKTWQKTVYIQRTTNGTFGEQTNMIFEGKVLNKSELKKIMQQCGISA